MKPFMRLPTVNVFQLKDVANIKSIVRLTKWLPPIKEEFDFLSNEYHRISSDRTRICYIVYHVGKIALFVNDLTNGQFDAMKDEDEDNDEESMKYNCI